METLKLSQYLKRGLKLARPEIPLFLLALCCVVGTASINLFLPNFQGKILDHVIEGRAACVLSSPPPPPPPFSPPSPPPPPAAAALVAAMLVEAEPTAPLWTAATASASAATASTSTSRLLAETSPASASTPAPTSASASASASASPPPPPPPSPGPPPTSSAECEQKRGVFLETVTMYLALSIATGALGGLRSLCFNLVGRRIMVWVRCRLFKC